MTNTTQTNASLTINSWPTESVTLDIRSESKHEGEARRVMTHRASEQNTEEGKIEIQRAENSVWANPCVAGIASLARLEEENRIMMFANVPHCSSENQPLQIVI